MKILYIVIGIMILALLVSFLWGKKQVSEQTFVDNQEMAGEMFLDESEMEYQMNEDMGMENQMNEDMEMFNEEMNIDEGMTDEVFNYAEPVN